MKFFWICFYVPIACFSIPASDFFSALDPRREEEFETLFRQLIAHDQVGYVLLGEKPVCWLGYHKETSLAELCNNHTSIYLRRLCEYLNAFSTKKNHDYLVKISKGPVQTFRDPFYEVLFINRKQLIKTVRENLLLFQYILGPDVTPETLLDQLIDPNNGFLSVLKFDQALMGIVLGYGVQNSIYYRRSYLLKSLDSAEKGSLFLKKNRWDSALAWNPLAGSDRLPSFGHITIEEERKWLGEKLVPLIEEAPEALPPFIHMDYVANRQSHKLISNYQRTRRKIQGALKGRLLKPLLCKLYTDFPNPETLPEPFSPALNEESLALIAHLLAKLREDYSENCQDSFLKGLLSRSPPVSFKEAFEEFTQLSKLKLRYAACCGLKKATSIFREISKQSDINWLVPGKLCYRVIKKGRGELTASESTNISFGYYFEDFSNNTLSGCFENRALADLTPGLIFCLQEMKVGEIREIWVHPEYIHGIEVFNPLTGSPNLLDGFKAKIELFHIEPLKDSSLKSFVDLTPKNFPIDDEEELRQKITELSQKRAFDLGCEIGEQLRLGFDLSKIAEALEQQPKNSNDVINKEEKFYYLHLTLSYLKVKQSKP